MPIVGVPYVERPEEPTEEDELEALEADELEADSITEMLEGLTHEDLKQWLASPFWKAIALMLEAQIQGNQQDLLQGGFAERMIEYLRTNRVTGAVYMNDDYLRGGLVAMEGFKTFPETLRQELDIAIELRKAQRQQQQGE